MNLIPAIYYSDIYLFLVALFTIFALNSFYLEYRNEDDWQKALSICIVFVLFLGTRPISAVFADMPMYLGIYRRWSGHFHFDWTRQNLLFDNLENFLASIRFNPVLHYIMFAGIYFGCILAACRKFFPDHITISFLCYCGAFSTFSYCVNGYKAGAAAAFFLVALAYRDNLKVAIPFILLSLGFHHSMPLPVVAFIVTQFYNRPKYYYYLWILCAVLSILHVSYFQNLFAGLTDEHGAEYLDVSRIGKDWGGNGTGFRFDFWIYSAMPALVGWWITNDLNIEDKFYNKLLCVYLFVNSVWLLCIYAAFTNRIAYLSWFMYPIVLIYPFFNEQLGEYRTTYIKYVVSLHLAFTIFMHVVYYG